MTWFHLFSTWNLRFISTTHISRIFNSRKYFFLVSLCNCELFRTTVVTRSTKKRRDFSGICRKFKLRSPSLLIMRCDLPYLGRSMRQFEIMLSSSDVYTDSTGELTEWNSFCSDLMPMFVFCMNKKQDFYFRHRLIDRVNRKKIYNQNIMIYTRDMMSSELFIQIVYTACQRMCWYYLTVNRIQLI